MPSNPRRRNTRDRRRLPPRPTYRDTSAPAAPPTVEPVSTPASRRGRVARNRDADATSRESRWVAIELRRVAFVSAACFGLLAVLAVVDRLG